MTGRGMVQVPPEDQLRALRLIERTLRQALEAIRDESSKAMAWAKEHGVEAGRHALIHDAAQDALEHRLAIRRKLKAEYARERGTGLERWVEP